MALPDDVSSPASPPMIARAPMTQADSPAPAPNDGSPPAPGRLALLVLAAGIAAGIIAWLAGEASLNALVPLSHDVNVMGTPIKKVEFKDQLAADYGNALVAFAWLGGLLGAGMGLAGGLARNSRPAALRAGAIGLVLGVGAALVASAAFLPIYFRALDTAKEELSRDLMIPLVVHAAIWSACGLAGGIALGVGLGGGWPRISKSALGGLVGAAIGAAAYELIGAFAFPSRDHTTSPVSWSLATRLLARLLVAALAALFAAIAVTTSGRPSAEPRPGAVEN